MDEIAFFKKMVSEYIEKGKTDPCSVISTLSIDLYLNSDTNDLHLSDLEVYKYLGIVPSGIWSMKNMLLMQHRFATKMKL